MAAKQKKLKNGAWEVTREIDLPVFQYKLQVVLSEDVKVSWESLTNKGKPSSDKFAAIHQPLTDRSAALVFPFKCQPCTVIHESWHAIKHLFDKVGLSLDHEYVAYHLDYLFFEITQFQKEARKTLFQKKRVKNVRTT